MELWCIVLICSLALAALCLLAYLLVLRHSLREAAEELDEKLRTDTNTLISISSGDRAMQSLVTHINRQLQALRRERLRLHSGNAELTAAVTNISHDLRTPLTSISGNAGILVAESNSIDPEKRTKIYKSIYDDSLWLVNLVENLLSVTRISDGGGGIQKVPDMAEDIVAHAVSQVRRRFPEQKLNVIASAEPFEVPMDSTLIEQVIINLIENAIYHSGSNEPITVQVEEKDGKAVFTVRDRGKGVDVGRMMWIMDGYVETDRPGDKGRGMGIGLSLCSSIVKAHGGTMTVENALDGGAVFSFALPMEQEKEINE